MDYWEHLRGGYRCLFLDPSNSQVWELNLKLIGSSYFHINKKEKRKIHDHLFVDTAIGLCVCVCVCRQGGLVMMCLQEGGMEGYRWPQKHWQTCQLRRLTSTNSPKILQTRASLKKKWLHSLVNAQCSKLSPTTLKCTLSINFQRNECIS